MVGSRVWWVAVGGNRRSRQLRCRAANKKEMLINIFKGAPPKPRLPLDANANTNVYCKAARVI